ncbi:hypothetical protein EAG_05405 [Camponotus floridanus]|uniref:Uncharacterized protein n=1 Tax=Camponotus floridanus TaxID=104421 RepID=E2A5Y7_CAMFO|nr:hypothetical protein EAG_05405 [Camponotus floridanus]
MPQAYIRRISKRTRVPKRNTEYLCHHPEVCLVAFLFSCEKDRRRGSRSVASQITAICGENETSATSTASSTSATASLTTGGVADPLPVSSTRLEPIKAESTRRRSSSGKLSNPDVCRAQPEIETLSVPAGGNANDKSRDRTFKLFVHENSSSYCENSSRITHPSPSLSPPSLPADILTGSFTRKVLA